MAANYVYGGEGDDPLAGSTQDDWIEGGAGADKLVGKSGADLLWGGVGNDVLTGGAGSDRFIFIKGEFAATAQDPVNPLLAARADTITDFDPATDHIELYGYAPGEWELTVDYVTGLARIRLSDGATIDLRIKPEAMAAFPDAISVQSGPGPAPYAPVEKGPVYVHTPVLLYPGTVDEIHGRYGYVVSTFGSLEVEGTIEAHSSNPDGLGVAGVLGIFSNGPMGTVHGISSGLATVFGVSVEIGPFDSLLPNQGTIWAENGGGPADAYYLWASNAELITSGTILAQSKGLTRGIYNPVSSYPPFVADIRIVNSGTIRAEGQEAYGFFGEQRAVVTNSGSIEAYGRDVAVALFLTFNGGATNSGTIIAETTAAGSVSIGISTANATDAFQVGGAEQAFVNSGTISADIAFYSYDDYGLSSLSSIENLTNSGVINGAVVMGAGADEVHNLASIHGNVYMGAGADFLDTSGGNIAGGVFAGAHDDILIGSVFADQFFGDDGADQLFGSNGDDLLAGGRGSDALDGGEGFDVATYNNSWQGVVANLATGVANDGSRDILRSIEGLIGSKFADTLVGSPSDDFLEGAAGNDILRGGAGADVLLGDTGRDKVTGGAGADHFRYAKGDGVDLYLDFAANGDADVLEVQGYARWQSIVQVGTDVRVRFSSTDQIILKNTTIAAIQDRITFDAGLPLPEPGPGILHTLTVEELTYVGRKELLEVGTLDVGGDAQGGISAVGVQMHFSGEAVPAVVNDGRIDVHGETDGTNAIGVAGDAGFEQDGYGFVNRFGANLSVSVTGASRVTGAEVQLIFNNGTVAISGNHDAVGFATAGVIVNTGSLSVSAGGAAIGLLGTFTFARIFNSGSVLVHGAEASTGATFNQDSIGNNIHDAFVNSGTISVSDETTARDSVGVDFSYGTNCRVYNSGVIEADFALRSHMYSTGTGTAYIYNSGELRGEVELTPLGDVLYNDGKIVGKVLLGEGNDAFEGRAGTQSGGVFGGAGDDTLLLGAGDDAIDGGIGRDLLWGGSGNDLLTGGGNADSFFVGSGADIVTDFAAASEKLFVVGYAAAKSIEQVGADVLVCFSDVDSVLLLNQSVAAITPSRFEFSFALPEETPGRIEAPVAPRTPKIGPAPVAPLPFLGTSGPDSLVGTSGNDAMFGSAGDDIIAGNAGIDRIEGGFGNDRLDGGAGADELVGGLGKDVLHSGGNNALRGGDLDRLSGGSGADVFEFDLSQPEISKILDYSFEDGDTIVLRNVQGNWTIVAYTGVIEYKQSRIYVGDGSLVGVTNPGPDLAIEVYGTAGDDAMLPPNGTVIHGLDGDDQIVSDIFPSYAPLILDDLFDGGNGNDTLISNEGDDIFVGGAGDDAIDGGSAADIAVFSQDRAAYSISGSPNSLTISGPDGTDSVANVEFLQFRDGYYRTSDLAKVLLVRGTIYDEQLKGGSAADVIVAGGGDDDIAGLGGNDALYGGVGDDRIDGGGGRNTIDAGWGDDTVLSSRDSAGSMLDGGPGTDTLDMSAKSVSLTFSATSRTAFGVNGIAFTAFEKVLGGTGNDVWNIGQYGLSVEFHGGDGDDDITGGGFGEAGNDTLRVVGSGALYGGAGDDVCIVAPPTEYVFGGGSVYVDGGDGIDTLVIRAKASAVDMGSTHGNIQGMQLTYLHLENVTIEGTGAGRHTISGGLEANLFQVGAAGDDGSVSVVFDGWGGDDTLIGGAGVDVLRGQFGADTIDGRGGDDRLVGGQGADLLSGGTGADRFIYTRTSDSVVGANDRIIDFRHAEGDLIDLSAIDAVAGGTDDSFVLASSFTGIAGQLTLVDKGNGTFNMMGDVDGDAIADIVIELASDAALTAVDYVL